jgi:hypothetical protein
LTVSLRCADFDECNMANRLLAEFLKEEGSDYVRELLRKAFKDRDAMYRKFEFNRFEVTIDRAAGSVLLEDVLDSGDGGAERIQIAELASALGFS